MLLCFSVVLCCLAFLSKHLMDDCMYICFVRVYMCYVIVSVTTHHGNVLYRGTGDGVHEG